MKTSGDLIYDRETHSITMEEPVAALRRRERLERPVVFIGMGTCGVAAGAVQTKKAVLNRLAAKGIQADVVDVGCIGLCSSEPLVDVQLPGRNRISYGGVTARNASALLDSVFDLSPSSEGVIGQFRLGQEAWTGLPFMDEHPFFALQTRWVLAHCGVIDPASLEEYVARGGYEALVKALQGMTPSEVTDTVLAAGLRGRGGAGFPSAQKWKMAAEGKSDQKFLICNADEGDPGAFMDRALIEGDPHRLLEGMALAAYAIGAAKAYIYIRAEYPLAIGRLVIAIQQAEAVGLLGDNILDSGFSLKMIIKKGAGAFVCGEETAMMHSIEGKRGMPRPRPPFPTSHGLFDKPSVINNVETLANVPEIIRRGAAWFSSLGTATSKGTKVFALSGNISRTGLVEVAMGTKIRDILFKIGGGIPDERKFKAVQIGGPSGGCLVDQHLDIDVDYESLKEAGAMMGSGGLVVMDEKTCMVDIAKYFMDFIQRESCGKCIPCREGTFQMLETLKAVTRARRNEKGVETLERFAGVMELEKLAAVIKTTSLCGLGQSAPNPVLSTLKWFRHEYEAHIFERQCPAGACAELKTFAIDAAQCTGCTLCAKKCPVGAVVGVAKQVHAIVVEKCVGCGTCVDVCRFDAVLVD